MIYYALRISEPYFRRLAQVRSLPYPHTITSVAFGLSYLHAISKNTQSLSVFDPSPENITYNRIIIRLIQQSESLDDFIETITGYSVVRKANEWNLFEPIRQSHRAWKYLQDPDLYFFFMNTVGRMQTYPNLYSATLKDLTVLFKGSDLTPQTFSWRFGEGVFRDENSFQVLQDALTSIPITFSQESIDKIPFADFSTRFPLITLVANNDSPLFFAGDKILRAFIKTSSVAVRYVSWHRDRMIYPSGEWEQWLSSLLQKKINTDFVSLGSSIKNVIPSLKFNESEYKTVASLRSAQLFGAPFLFIDLNAFEHTDTFFTSLQEVVAPSFHRIGCMVEGNGPDIINALYKSGFFDSYIVTHLEQNHSKYFLELTLKGL